MSDRIVVIGGGSSANRYVKEFLGDNDLKAILDSTGEKSLPPYSVGKINTIVTLDFDQVIIASWAVDQLVRQLLMLQIHPDKIFIFLNDRDKTISLQEWQQWTATDDGKSIANHTISDTLEDMEQPVKRADQKTLYAFYDLAVARPTFDVLSFLCLAEIYREKLDCVDVHLVIVSSPISRDQDQLLPLMNYAERDWRIRNILIPSGALLPSCSGVTLCSSRAQAASMLSYSQHAFPLNYTVENPIEAWEFNHLFKEVDAGQPIHQLTAPTTALDYVDRWLNQQAPANKKSVTITLRESTLQPKRNSDTQQWLKFLEGLDRDHYFPIIVRDTETALTTENLPGDHIEFSEASFNLELRMALYQRSYVNLGVNTGPAHLWVFNKDCRYLMFRHVHNDYSHSSEASFKRRNFPTSGDFPGAAHFQHLVWEDDRADIITREFEKLCDRIDADG